MQFSTRIPLPDYAYPINYDSEIVSLGSCFATNIGARFSFYKFKSTVNPFGILFHPLALEKFIGFAVQQKVFSEADIFFYNGLWHCFDAHSGLSHPDKEVMLQQLNNALQTARLALSKASHLILTLGTAWAYRHSQSGAIVANCHKVPQKEFTKELLSVNEVCRSIIAIKTFVKSINPFIQLVITVSPVRHIKDGFIENQRSKAHLLAGLHEAIADGDSVTYFPSYEIMMDELRDYRFYADDMIHPSPLAIDYIWQRFSESFISNDAHAVMAEVEAIQKGYAHRAFNPDSEQHKKFLSALQQRAETLQKTYSHITF
jgi:hypothetical protein